MNVNIKDLRIGDIVKWVDEYEILSIYEDSLDIKRLNSPCSGKIFHRYKIMPREILFSEVKDTRLARKMYPDHEVLDNGMLRIRRV